VKSTAKEEGNARDAGAPPRVITTVNRMVISMPRMLIPDEDDVVDRPPENRAVPPPRQFR